MLIQFNCPYAATMVQCWVGLRNAGSLTLYNISGSWMSDNMQRTGPKRLPSSLYTSFDVSACLLVLRKCTAAPLLCDCAYVLASMAVFSSRICQTSASICSPSCSMQIFIPITERDLGVGQANVTIAMSALYGMQGNASILERVAFYTAELRQWRLLEVTINLAPLQPATLSQAGNARIHRRLRTYTWVVELS